MSEDLFRYLKSGICSPALQQFLTKELYDTKILQKLDEVIFSLFYFNHLDHSNKFFKYLRLYNRFNS